MQQKKWGKSAGWWGESERHRLAKLGYHTGTKYKTKNIPPYLDAIAHIPMSQLFTGREFVDRRADRNKLLSYFKEHGWQYRETPRVGGFSIEAWKGKNYLLLNQTHWQKLEVEEAFIRDKDEGERLKTVLRKPYPYRIKDYAKASTEQEIHDILYNPKSDAVDKEVLTIEIPRSKLKELDFLDTYTKFSTKGKWKDIVDDNAQIEIEFKDAKNEKYGLKLMSLFNKLNKEKIKEKVLYVRTEPIEESTL